MWLYKQNIKSRHIGERKKEKVWPSRERELKKKKMKAETQEWDRLKEIGRKKGKE